MSDFGRRHPFLLRAVWLSLGVGVCGLGGWTIAQGAELDSLPWLFTGAAFVLAGLWVALPDRGPALVDAVIRGVQAIRKR